MNQERQVAPVPAPFQFGLATLLQFTAVVALWCGASIARFGISSAMAYALVVLTVTWLVVGGWAVRLSPTGCRRALAATTTLLVLGAMGVTALVNDTDYLPVVWLLTFFLSGWPVIALGSMASSWTLVAAVAWAVLMLLILYTFWLVLYRLWDVAPHQRFWVFAVLISLLALPLLWSISGGCFLLVGHETKRAVVHTPLHCLIHVGMLFGGFIVMGLLWRHRNDGQPEPKWLKLAACGYLSFYAVLCQVALFPFFFYIP